jgi:hypothetical protein
VALYQLLLAPGEPVQLLLPMPLVITVLLGEHLLLGHMFHVLVVEGVHAPLRQILHLVAQVAHPHQEI